MLKTLEEYINLERGILVFSHCIEVIGLSDKIGVLNITSMLNELMREKITYLNFLLIQKYHTTFLNLLLDEKCINLEVNNESDYLKYVSQYDITFDDNSKTSTGFIYPFKLPYTKFVLEVNENYKKYVMDIFSYICPLYQEHDTIMQIVVKDFLKKLNEVFISFINFTEQDIHIILAAQICNNIRYIFKSYNFYSEYLAKAANIRQNVDFDSTRSLKEAW